MTQVDDPRRAGVCHQRIAGANVAAQAGTRAALDSRAVPRPTCRQLPSTKRLQAKLLSLKDFWHFVDVDRGGPHNPVDAQQPCTLPGPVDQEPRHFIPASHQRAARRGGAPVAHCSGRDLEQSAMG